MDVDVFQELKCVSLDQQQVFLKSSHVHSLTSEVKQGILLSSGSGKGMAEIRDDINLGKYQL